MNDRTASLCHHFRSRLHHLITPLICGAVMLASPARAGVTVPPTFSMSVSPDTIGVGSCTELTFTIDASAVQQTPINGLAFSLNLPAGVTIATPANATNNCGGILSAPDGGSSISLTGGEIATGICTIQVGLTLAAPGPFVLTSGDLTSSAGNSGTATATLGTPSQGPVLGFSKSFSPNLVPVGGPTTLTYTIENQSAEDATNLSFTDVLPAGIIIATPSNAFSNCAGIQLTAVSGTRNITFDASPTLPAGESCTLTLDVIGLDPGLNNSVSGDLTFNGSGGTSSAGFACAVLEVLAPEDVANITFTKEFTDDPVDPGGTGTLEFTITNNSLTETFSNIVFTDDLNATLPGLLAVDLPTLGGPIINGTFDDAGPTSVISGNWDYLDRIENELGANQSYPDDGDGNEWYSPDFDVATSEIGPWGSAAAPLQGGTIDGFPPGTPEVLFGIDTAPDGVSNLITTYLFRNDFTLTAAQAAEDDWYMEYLIDDGAIIYVNGVEVLRTPSMPAGAVNTNTLSGLGDENSLESGPVNLTGLLSVGANTIAVEVHQNTLESSDVGLLLSLLPAANSSTVGFAYSDDTFNGTVDPEFAEGSLDPTGGFDGGGLTVLVGGQSGFGNQTPASSGGWSRFFNLDDPTTVTISLRYRLLFEGSHENDEFGQALLELDGILFGNGPGNSLAQFTGDGNNGPDHDTGWQQATFNIFLAAGNHTILLGAYNNKSTVGAETTQVWFDHVEVGTPLIPAPVCGPNSQFTGSDLLTFLGGSLGPGQSCTFSVGVQVPVSTPTGSYLNTTSRITTTVLGSPLIGFPASDTLVVEPIPPAFSKSFSPDGIAGGGTSTLIFTIDNRSSQLDATGIDFTDTLPAGLVIANPPNAGTDCTGGTLTAVSGTAVISYTGGAIAAGASCTVIVNVTAGDPGAYLNTSGDLTSDLGNSGPASATLTVNPPPLFAKSFAPASLNAGQVGTLTFTIDNSASTTDATGISFTDNLPAGLVLANPVNFSSTCVGGSVSAGPASSNFSYSGGTVPAGASCTLTVEVTSLAGGTYLNTTGDLTSSLGNSGSASDTLEVEAIVSIMLTKSESVDPVIAGSGAGNLTYLITTTNSGPSTATGITVTEALTIPAGVSLVSITPSAGTTFSDPLWTIGTLASGGSATLTVVLTADASAPPGLNVITATLASVNETNIGDVTSVTESTSIVNRSDLQVTTTESIDPVIAGSGAGNLDYLITVTNIGPSHATNVALARILNLPSGVSVDSVSPSAGTSFDAPTWTVGSLDAGTTATLRVVLTVNQTAAMGTDVISSGAAVTSLDQTDINPQNNSAALTTSISNEVEIAISKTASIDPVLAGSGDGNLVYTITATNTGPSDASGVVIGEALILPAGVTVDSITPSAGTYSPANDPNGFWILSLPVGATETLIVTLTIAADAPNGATISNTASLQQVSGTDTDDSNNSASEETTILAGVDLVVTKSDSIDPVIAGSGIGNLIYLVTVTNNGPLDATGLELSEILSFGPGVVIASVTPGAGTFTDTTWTVGDLANGASAILTVTLTVGPSTAVGTDTISNTASISAVDQPQNNPGDESDTESTSVIREVDLVVTVTESRDPVLAGFNLPGNLRHTVWVTNNGPSDASGVILDIAQVLPAGVTVGSLDLPPGTSFTDPSWSVGDLAFDATASLPFDLSVPAPVPGGLDTIATSGMVSGANEPIINDGNDAASESTSVVSPASFGISGGEIVLDLQSSLFKQTVTITNNNPTSVPAFRLLVNGLPQDVTVHNAQGESGGSSYLLYNQALAPGASIDLVVEYSQLDLSGGFEPSFEIELLDAAEAVTSAEGAELDRIATLPNGDILIEFKSTVGTAYTIQYSQDGENWFGVVPKVLAGTSRTQWIDNGPPKTPRHPSSVKGRLYRVVQDD
ncbi:MAG: hypothetical protein VCA38_12080 [Roseibacillus sp.]